MAQETTKEKSGGLAYEVILKPASTESPARPPSPPKNGRPLSQVDIEKKLAEAEKRRQEQETSKLELVKKVKERTAAANEKIDKLNRSFSEEAEKKLVEKMENMELKKSKQMQALQNRLKEHAKKVEEVRQASEKYVKELRERIDQKLEVAQENREKQIRIIQERIKEHEAMIEKAMQEVQDSNNKFSKATEEKLVAKMNATMKNREQQLKQLQERLKEHDDHVQMLRQLKASGDALE